MRRLLSLAVAASALPSLSAADDLSAPIATRNHRAVSLAFLRFSPSEGVSPSGTRTASFSWSQANDFRREGAEVEDDYEITRVSLVYTQGLPGYSLRVEVPVVARHGGFLDPLIDGWHQAVLGWTDPERDGTPFGRTVLRVPGSLERGSSTGLGDVSVEAAKSIGRVTARLGLKLPTGNAGDLLGSGGIDVGIAVERRLRLSSKWAAYGMAGLVRQGDGRAIRREREWVDQASIALIHTPNSKDAWIAQWQSEASAQRSFVPGSDAPHRLVTLGYRRRLSSNQMIEGYFSEDRDVVNRAIPEIANVGPDFTAGVRWQIRL